MSLADPEIIERKSARPIIYIVAILLFLIAKLGGYEDLAPIVSAVAFVALLISLPAASWGPRILTAFFLIGGLLMLTKAQAPWTSYLLAHGGMLYLLALFAVLPVLSVPVELGGYAHSIEKVLRARVRGTFQLNILVTSFAFICGSFMSIAAIPIMMTSMARAVSHFPLKNSVQFRSVAATNGYVLPILWTPVAGVVGVVVQGLELRWVSLLPLLVSLSLGGLVVNWLVFYLIEVRGRTVTVLAKPSETSEITNLRPELSHLAQILAAVAIMVISIAWIDYSYHLGMMMIVTLIAIPFAAIWSLALEKGKDFARVTQSQMTSQLARMPDQFAVFLAAGFFVSALQISGLDHTLNLGFLHLHEVVGTKPLLLLMPFMALAVACIGVHPVVAIALLGESLKPAVLGIDVRLLALTLIGSAVLTYMLSPFGGTLGLMQSITRISSFRLSLWNLPYALGYWLLLSAVILVY